MRRWDLMFGRVPRLPVDIMFGSALRNDDVQTYDEYVETLQKDLREAMRIPQAKTRSPEKASKGVQQEIQSLVLPWKLEIMSHWSIRKKRGKKASRCVGLCGSCGDVERPNITHLQG